jgi:hypothetical protein
LWVIIALACLIALIIILLCVPVDIAFRLEYYERAKFSVNLGWLFGVIKKEIKPSEKAEEKPRKEKKKEKPWSGSTFTKLPVRDLLRQIKILLEDIAGLFNIRDINLDMTAGFDDPADTGYLCAAVYPVLALYSSQNGSINFQPSFEGKNIFEGYADGTLRFFPVRFIVPLVRFIFSGSVLKTARIMVAEKWKRKK